MLVELPKKIIIIIIRMQCGFGHLDHIHGKNAQRVIILILFSFDFILQWAPPVSIGELHIGKWWNKKGMKSLQNQINMTSIYKNIQKDKGQTSLLIASIFN